MHTIQEDMFEKLKEKKRGHHSIFKEWGSNTWANPCNR
ncbi:hypothetical protein IC1_04635 [Bacillus cereus VD022]|uniref:Uncharacterized protein n=1 Tax=Bacillus cereus TIAC219 TaxID=718222 RepID=A0ABC9SR29_BACCE|nr:hypothetical protein IC1_04635 [Bacillus cereus VD022]EOQ58088.1 hypothetical protein IAY_03734 [Bacillus cereus TIAC219]